MEDAVDCPDFLNHTIGQSSNNDFTNAVSVACSSSGMSVLSALTQTDDPQAADVDTDDEEHEDDALEPGDIPVSLENALIINETYKHILWELIAKSEEALKANQLRQRAIEEELQNLSSALPVTEQVSASRDPRKSLTVFMAPYFKDADGFSAPPNRDTIQRRRAKGLCPYTAFPREWSLLDKRKLVSAVRAEALTKKLNAVVQKPQRSLLPDIDNAVQADQTKEPTEANHLAESEMNKLEDAGLFDDINEEQIDWMKISASVAFHQSYSAKQCRLVWKNLLHPKINKSAWSKTEDDQLKVLHKTHKNDWDAIACKLETGRTAYQCFVRFQQKHAVQWRTSRWTQEEDRLLHMCVDQCRINRYIPWTKVAFYIKDRTRSQCYQRYIYCLKEGLQKGPFTELEVFAILIGYKVYGKNWSKIASFLPRRQAAQVYSRYMVCSQAGLSPWTSSEDVELLKVVRDLGTKKWTEVAAQMTTKRNRAQCRKRFYQIFKEFRRQPNSFDLSQFKYSNFTSSNQQRHLKLLRNLVANLHNFLSTTKVMHLAKKAVDFSCWNDVSAFLDESNVPIEALEGYLVHIKKQLLGKITTHKDTTRKNKPKKMTSAIKCSAILPKVDRMLLNIFQASWYKKVGRRKLSFRPEEMRSVTVMACYYAHLLSIKPCSNLQTADDHPLRSAAWAAFESQFHSLLPTLTHSVESDAAPTTIRTYSRKKTKPTTSSRTGQETELPLIPPSRASLIGFRGLLIKYSSGRSRIETDHSRDAQTANEADLLLRDRFRSLFLWPAILSRHPPQTKNNLFGPADDSIVSAVAPFDTANLMENVVKNTQSGPTYVMKMLPRPIQTKTLPAPCTSQTSDPVDEPLSPPPIKKPHLDLGPS